MRTTLAHTMHAQTPMPACMHTHAHMHAHTCIWAHPCMHTFACNQNDCAAPLLASAQSDNVVAVPSADLQHFANFCGFCALLPFLTLRMDEGACFISLLAVGTPWCEMPTKDELSFQEWLERAFGPDGAPQGLSASEGRQMEFLTALGSRVGGDALLKPRDALDVPQPARPASGVVRLGFRKVHISPQLRSQITLHKTKSIFGKKTKCPLRSWVVVLPQG